MRNRCKRCDHWVEFLDEGVWRRAFESPEPDVAFRTGSSVCDDGELHDPMPDLTNPLDIERWLSA